MNAPDMKQRASEDWPAEARCFGINTRVGSCHEHRLKKVREVAEKHRMVWGRAAPKPKTFLPQVLVEGERHKTSLLPALGS